MREEVHPSYRRSESVAPNHSALIERTIPLAGTAHLHPPRRSSPMLHFPEGRTMQKKILQQVTEQWERAIERAAEEQGHKPELDTSLLRDMEGFQIRSSIRAGRGYYSTYPTGCPQRCG